METRRYVISITADDGYTEMTEYASSDVGAIIQAMNNYDGDSVMEVKIKGWTRWTWTN